METVTHTLTILLQIAAAGLALHLLRGTSNGRGWLLVAIAFGFMALNGSAAMASDRLNPESSQLPGLIIAALLVTGLGMTAWRTSPRGAKASTTADDSESRLRALWTHMPEHAAELDRNGAILSVNRKPRNPKNADIRHRTLFEFAPENEHQKILDALAKTRESGEPTQFEFQVDTDSGPRWWSTCLIPLTDTYYLLGTETTEHHRAQQSLEQRNERQESIAQFGQICLADISLPELFEVAVQLVSRVLKVDLTMLLELSPDRAEVFLRAGVGWDPGSLGHAPVTVDPNSQIGYTLARATPVVVDRMCSETRFAGPQVLLDHGVVSGASILIGTVEDPFGLLGIHARKHHAYSENDVYFLQAVANLLATAIGRHRAEQALRESEERLDFAIQATNLGVWDWHIPTDEVILCEQWADMLGYSLDEITGIWEELIHPDDSERIVAAIADHIEGRTPFYESEHRLRTKHGEWLWVHDRGIVVERDRDGTPIRVTGTHQDITARKRAEEEKERLAAQLQQVQKLESLGVLAGGIAHDFNNLLTGILGNASLSQSSLPPDSPALRTIEQIETASMRASDLCKQLLAYSGKGRFVIQPLDLSELVQEMLAILKVSISKKASIHLDLASKLPAIEADATQIRQIVMNLITNASDTLAVGGGTITISTGVIHCERADLQNTYLDDRLEDGDYVFVQVADNGAGMDEETQQKLFDPFFTTKMTGRGLGLAAVLGIVRGHRGAMKISSEVGLGSEFRVLFPAVATVAHPLQLESNHTTDRTRGSGLILVVDDEATVRDLAKAALEMNGYDVILANDGAEGVDAFTQHHEQLYAVILDMTMPNLNGEEAFHQMRKVSGSVPVILSSGFSERESLAPFDGQGIAGFVQKPYRPRDLLTKIREVTR